MSEWWTYRLSDFLLFSADIYFRLFELYNESIWPAQVLALTLGVLAIFWILRPHKWSGRLLYFLLAGGWLWVAWGYHITHFSTINWAATWYAAGFALQAVLLMLAGGLATSVEVSVSATRSDRVGLGLAGFGLVLQPLLWPLAGRPWVQVELFGLAPDPTAVFTLGFILLAGRLRWLLLPIPILWCVISGAMLWTMDMAGWWVMPGAAGIAIIVSVTGKPEPSA